MPDIETCATHGEWRRDVVGGDGAVRYLANCPRCVGEYRARSVLERSAIPKRFIGKSLLHYRDETDGQKHALQVAFSYANAFKEVYEKGQCLLFVGRPGTGKTHLACGIAQHVMNGGRSAAYATVADIILAVRDTWRRDSEITERQAYALFNKIDLLIIDEVGVQTGSDDERRILHGVIGARAADQLPMIVMSNLPPESTNPREDSVKSFLGARLFDRLHEGGGKTVIFNWPSHRRAA